MIKKGDNVRFLNAVGGGTVVRIDADKKLIGYYEKHEYRNLETMKPYDLW